MKVRELFVALGFKFDSNSAKNADNAIKATKDNLSKAGDEGKNAGDKISSGMRTVSPIVQGTAASIRAMGAVASAVGESIREAMTSAKSSIKSVGSEAEKSAEKTKSLKHRGEAMKTGGMEVAAAGAVTLAPIVLPVKQAIDFESAMADVRKVVDFDTPEQFDEMGNSILEMTKYLPMTATEIAKIVAAGGQSGIEKEKLLEFAEAATKMGVAFDITAEQSGEMMAKWRTAFKMTQPEVEELADKINQLGNKTAASAPLISDVARRIGPLGSVGGVASGEIAALGASLVGSGVESEVAATGIKNMILALVAGESATKSQIGAFNQLGFEAGEMAERMQVDAKGAIKDVFAAIKNLDKAKQMSVMKELFGSESLSAIGPLLANLDNLQKNFDLVADRANYAGSMQGEFDARCKTTQNSLVLVQNVISIIGNNIGKAFLPIIKDVAKTFMEFGDSVINFVKNNPTITKFIMFAIAGLGSLLVILGTLGILIGGIITLFTTLAPVVAPLIGGITIGFTILCAKIILIVAAIAAVLYALYWLYDNWDAIWISIGKIVTDFFNGITQGVSDATNNFVAGFLAAIEAVKNFFVGLKDFALGIISEIGSAISDFIGGKIAWAADKISSLKDWAADKAAQIADSTTNNISNSDSRQYTFNVNSAGDAATIYNRTVDDYWEGE